MQTRRSFVKRRGLQSSFVIVYVKTNCSPTSVILRPAKFFSLIRETGVQPTALY